MPRSILAQRDQWPDRYADNNLFQADGEVISPADSQNDNDFYDANSSDPLHPRKRTVEELANAIQQEKGLAPHAPGESLIPGASGSASSGSSLGAPAGGSATAGGTPVAGSGGVPLIKNPDGTYTSSDPEWAKLINRESGGRNIKQSPSTKDVNSGGNEAFGLFQITPGTWKSHGGQGSVYDSTPEQQAAVAAEILRKNPTGSDWGAGLAGRENPQALMKGLSSDSSAAAAGATAVAPGGHTTGTTGPDTHGAILPDAAAFKTNLQKQFPQVTNIGGYRDPDGFNEHSSGHALDVMIPDKATQDQVRDWTLKQPNVNYVLNQQKQWNPDGSSSGMDDRGSPTGNHFDHLHVNVAGDYKPDPSATQPAPTVAPDGSSLPKPASPTQPTAQPAQPTQPGTPAQQQPAAPMTTLPTTLPKATTPPPTTPDDDPSQQQPPPMQQMTIAQRKRASTFFRF